MPQLPADRPPPLVGAGLLVAACYADRERKEADPVVSPAKEASIRRGTVTRRTTWLAGIDAIPDPVLRAKIARAELEAAVAHLAATADAAFLAAFEAIGGTRGGGWAKVGELIGGGEGPDGKLTRPVARRHGMRALERRAQAS